MKVTQKTTMQVRYTTRRNKDVNNNGVTIWNKAMKNGKKIEVVDDIMQRGTLTLRKDKKR